MTEDEDAFDIKLPFFPDRVVAYKHGLCILCAHEIRSNPDFDNTTCYHCKKLNRRLIFTKSGDELVVNEKED
jgi:hypothetical protein